VIVRYRGCTYAAIYPKDAVISHSTVWRDLQKKRWGYGHVQKFFRRYDPVADKFVQSYYSWIGKAARRLRRGNGTGHRRVRDDHPWAAYRRVLNGPPPPPDHFPARWQSPRLKKLADDIRARAEVRRNNPTNREDGE
jgi:hypothetical protein